ncbi:MAG: CPBP family intramembrane metalloprotease [Candidatus Korarchaeota archaeon]|nr:CPBP family intramembrane metalloprotease [Candidatus Korarchaeota archaeon]NIU82038.1 CPBP family intramembrane metalloprotease [Candidatus Thorarchaeota archaeon]NIW12457.1 CPBP family intramembrane metalloprotease [Candidatus Thorarchaeota archaeon]NIW50672.1 CPBP family intramembrane metalloprotease [Candidatus Korarchaeota archaeon]
MADANIDIVWLLALFCFSLAVGITEEATFRLFGISTLTRLLRKGLNEKDAWRGGIVVLSAVFAVNHLLLTNLWSQQPISTLVRTFLTGLALGYLFKNVGYEACVLAHGSLNFLAFIALAIMT